MSAFFKYIKSRFSEASTWRGIIAIITAAGVNISPELQNSIVALGLAVMGLIGVVIPDSTPDK